MSKNIEITILGCGSSGGVPRVGGDWGACDPNEPKNRRRRSSILIEYWEGDVRPPHEECTVVLIDSAPDLREQLLDAHTQHIDAVLYTHDHGDQTHGMDDLRAIAYRKRTQIPVYMDEVTSINLLTRFTYCFVKPEGRVHPPILSLQPLIKSGDNLQIFGPGGTISIDVFEVAHGSINALGFIFCGTIAYSPDAHTISDEVLEKLTDMDLWIVDALRYHRHPTHAHADQALVWGAITRTKQLVFTNMHIDMDTATLNAELPGNQLVGYDNMKIVRKIT
ncbi:MAG: phosphoribosyl 1,2-cyclic phosphodiesterase [Robiginitomaculum sp.]|nr:MAG: phosphoribosyl 1,2-cyclic phosphodiesterase [Robiginitomaculum sp.]